MAIAYTLGPHPYILKRDKDLPEEEQTTFQLKNRTQEQWDHICPSWASTGTGYTLLGSTATKILKKVLAGWENYLDKDGNEIPYQASNMKANLNALNAGMRMELAGEVLDRNELTDTESKN